MHNIKKQLLCSSALVAVAFCMSPSSAWAGSFICQSGAPGTISGAGGSTAVSGGSDNMACGSGNTVSGAGTIGSSAIGVQNTAIGQYSTAVGWQTTADSTQNPGPGGEVHGATAVGDVSNATGDRSTAVGSHQTASGVYSTALGRANLASGQSSVAIGDSSTASAQSTVAIGKSAVANIANSVALGNNALTTAALSGAYSINGGTIAGTGANPGIVSVGQAGQESVIQNVHAGVVSAASTEAVNGSQLYALGTAVNTGLTGTANALGGGANWNSATGSWTAPTFTLSDGSTYNTVQDALANITANNPYYAANSTGAAASATGANALAMGQNAQATTAGSVAIGANSVANTPNLGAYNYYTGDSTNIAAPTTAATQVVSIGSVGNERQLQNVAAGVVSRTSTDAINGSQLFAMGEGVNALGSTAASILGGGTTYTAGSGLSGTNYAIQGSNYNNVGDALGALNNAVSTSNANYNDLNLNGTKYYKSNSTGAAAQANGADSLSMGAGSVAGAQNSVAMGTGASATGVGGMALGAGASVLSDGGVAIGSGSVADAPHIGRYTINGGTVAGATTASTQVVSFGTDAAPRQLQNVATGVVSQTSTDAINGSQLYAVSNAVNNGLTGSANGLGGGARWDAATGSWTGPNYTINGQSFNNIGGAVAAANDSTNSLGTSTAAALGGGSTYTPGQGVSAPTYNVQGNTYRDVGSALSGVNNSINNINGSIAGLQNGMNYLGAQINGLGQQQQAQQREYRQGVAMASALPSPHFPSAAGKTTMTVSSGAFKGYGAVGAALMHRLDTKIPIAVGVSAAAGFHNSVLGRAELVAEF